MSRILRIILALVMLLLSGCAVGQSEGDKSNTLIIRPKTLPSPQVAVGHDSEGDNRVRIETKPYIEVVVKKSTIPGITSGFGFRDRVLIDSLSYEQTLNQYLEQRNQNKGGVTLSDLRVEHAVGSDVSGVYADFFLYSGNQLLSHSLGHYTDKDYRYREFDNHGQSMLSEVVFKLFVSAIYGSDVP